jgi:hypothetical protein
MSLALQKGCRITRIVKYIYEAEGREYEAIPVPQENLKSFDLPSASEECDGSYICVDGWRYRYMFNHETKQCEYFRTNEVC